MLSAYIADDDYCQGIEIIEKSSEHEHHLITSINWDLDHAFLFFKDGQYSMPAIRNDLGEAFDILKHNKPHSNSLCPRKWVLSHVYKESEKFRHLVRERLELLLENELSAEYISSMIDKYRVIDEGYYQGSNKKALDEMENFAQQRPLVLKQAINDLEAWVKSGVYSTY